MREAITLSEDNITKGGGPFGALVVKQGMVIGRGVNTVTLQNDPTAHAEVNAIRAACQTIGTFDLSDCIIYTSCEPCPMCLSAIYWARIKEVYYANTRNDAQAIDFDDAFIYNEIPLPIDQRSIQFTRILSGEALQAFKNWELYEGKTTY